MHVSSPSRRPFLRPLGALAAAAAFGSTARAQGTPCRFLVGFPAGGTIGTEMGLTQSACIVRAAEVREALASA